MKELENNFMDERKEYFNLKETLLKYWGHKRYFIFFGCGCLLLAVCYILIATPAYQITASITIHDEERGGSKNEILSAERLFYSGRDWLNSENEIEVLKSSSLLEQAVTNLKLYTSYFWKEFMCTEFLYKSIPITVDMEPNALKRIESPIVITLDPLSGKNIEMAIVTNVDDNKWEKSTILSSLPATLDTPYGRLNLSGNMQALCKLSKTMEIVLNNPVETARDYADRLSVSLVSRTSSIVNMEFNSPNRELGMDFMRELIRCYNQRANEDKNRVARRTADFLQNRIEALNHELDATDGQLESFKRKAGLTNMDVDTKAFLEENSKYGREMTDVESQLSLLQYLNTYVQKSENKENIIPGDIGLKDVSLSKTIEAHNQLVLEYQRLSRTSSASNPVSLNLKNQIRGSFQNVVTAIENTYSGTLLTKKEIERKANLFKTKINDMPAYERMMTEIIRQQETKSSLYLDLLQKMEENALMLEAVTENAKFIDTPYSETKPSSPNKVVILLAALFFGGFLALVWIFFVETFSSRIVHPDEVTKRFGDLPLLGKISRHKKGTDVVNDFRRLKTRIQLVLNEINRKTLCVFSYNDGDGKTYIVSNLACQFAQFGKKTLLLHLELQKNNESENEIKPSLSKDNLYECPVTPQQLQSLKELCNRFDYILIDSISLKTCPEMLALGELFDYSVYVCRIRHSDRNSLNELDEIGKNNFLPHLSVVINDIG